MIPPTNKQPEERPLHGQHQMLNESSLYYYEYAEGGKTGYTAAAGLCLASLATVNGKEYILVTLAAPGDHGTEQYNIRDAVHVYRKLADKK